MTPDVLLALAVAIIAAATCARGQADTSAVSRASGRTGNRPLVTRDRRHAYTQRGEDDPNVHDARLPQSLVNQTISRLVAEFVHSHLDERAAYAHRRCNTLWRAAMREAAKRKAN